MLMICRRGVLLLVGLLPGRTQRKIGIKRPDLVCFFCALRLGGFRTAAFAFAVIVFVTRACFGQCLSSVINDGAMLENKGVRGRGIESSSWSLTGDRAWRGRR